MAAILSTISLGFACVLAQALEAPDLREIIRKVNETTRAVTAVSYTARIWPEGARGRVPPTHARVVMTDPKIGPGVRFAMEAESDEGAPTPFRLTIASDGHMLTRIDWGARQAAIGRADKNEIRLGQIQWRLLMREFCHLAPFDDELGAEKLTYEGRREINGVDCHVILVQYGRRGGTSRWYFGVQTHLPQRVDRVSDGYVLELADVDTSPDVQDSRFSPTIPREFEVRDVLPEGANLREPPILPYDWPAPNWSLPSAAGGEISLSQFADKVVVLDFWSTWAQPCAEWMPRLQKIHGAYESRGVVILGISSFEEDDANPAAVMRERGCTYGLLLGGDDVYRQYRVPGAPTTVVIGRNGRIRYAAAGTKHIDALKQAIEDALSDRSPSGE